MIERWQRLSPRGQRWLIALVVLAALVVLIGGINRVGGTPGGPRLSSYATGRDGLAAVESLLKASGYRTDRLRVALDDAPISGEQTVVALGQAFTESEQSALRAWVTQGGRLVIGGPESEPFLRTFAPELRWHPDGNEQLRAVNQAPVTGVESLRADGLGVWRDAPGSALARAGAETTAFELHVGAGSVAALADPTPLANGLLTEADNAGFALNVVGDPARRVLFAEYAHGFGLSAGLAALPANWRAALWFGAIAALVGALAAGKRLGPPDPVAEAIAPSRVQYVSAVAATLARTRDIDAAVGPLRDRALELLARRSGRVVTSDPASLAAAGHLAGLSPAEIATLTAPIADTGTLVALGRTVSRLEEH